MVKKTIFVTARRGDLDIPVSCDKSTKDFRGGISEHTTFSSNVSSEAACRVTFPFVLHRRQFFFRRLYSGRYSFYCEATETPLKPGSKFSATLM
jgi:hypothetical protein